MNLSTWVYWNGNFWNACVGPQGAYVEERIISADYLVPLPNSVGDVVAASIMIKGMTAQMLLRRVFKVLSQLYGFISTFLVFLHMDSRMLAMQAKM
jgi:NADPH:quinone reductase-like Zn-dependent oxidoreductase